jgi:hypothetical protein
MERRRIAKPIENYDYIISHNDSIRELTQDECVKKERCATDSAVEAQRTKVG